MADQAFGKGSEKLTSEQKPATDPQEEAADDDSQVKSPVQQRGDYGEKDYVSTPRSTDYCRYGDVDDDDITHKYFFPEGCDAHSAIYGERTKEQWEITLPRLSKIINHLFRCRVNGKKVWAKMPKGSLQNAHLGPRYSTNMILNKYLNGMSENRTGRTLEYQIGMDISRKTVNTHVNKLLSGIRSFMEDRFKWWILQDDYLGIDETVEDVFVDCEDGKRHLRTRYHWGICFFAKAAGHKVWITRLLNPFVWLGSFVLQPLNKMFATYYYDPEMSKMDFDYQLASFEESLRRMAK